MVVLKHLAREFDLNPPALRRILRDEFGYHKRWQWKTEDDPELIKIRQFLSSLRSKKQSRLNASSPGTTDTPDTPSSSTTRRPTSVGSRSIH
jgi:hypothetical protein